MLVLVPIYHRSILGDLFLAHPPFQQMPTPYIIRWNLEAERHISHQGSTTAWGSLTRWQWCEVQAMASRDLPLDLWLLSDRDEQRKATRPLVFTTELVSKKQPDLCIYH